MRFISNLDQHPDNRKKRFPEHLWPPESSDEQTKDEWWILLEFLQAADHSIEKAPRKGVPDFECIIGGKKRLFELGEILDSSLAGGLAYSEKQSHRKSEALLAGNLAEAASIQTSGGRSFSANGALLRMLKKKLTGEYICDGTPCDLLLFYDFQTPYGPFECILELEAIVVQLLEESSFETIWLFNLPAAQVMGRVRMGLLGKISVIFDQTFSFDKHAAFNALVPGVGNEPDRMQRFEPVLSRVRVPKK